MDQYYNEYFQGRQQAPIGQGDEPDDPSVNTHYQASNMMGGGNRANGGYNASAAYGNGGAAQGASPG